MQPMPTPQAKEHRRDDAGFTLVELLIVMSVILIIITLAIPSYEHVHIKANETSAIASVRMLNSMETEYNSSYPSHGFACSLATLGGKQNSAGTAEAAGLIPDDLASGSKAGYNFTISNCAKNTVNNVDQYNSYQITATPVNVGKTGNRTFCSDETGQIRFDPKGGTNCTEILQ
jgi:type IV pilus assembly protein PilA